MRSRVLDLVVCLRCGGRLDVREETMAQGEELLEGMLACWACGSTYPVRGGVPRLLEGHSLDSKQVRATVDRFASQWAQFDRLAEHYEEQFLGWIRPNRPDAFQAQVVLDAGCGKGRHAALVSQWGARDILALDLGDAVTVAFANTRHLENVHVVQADLFRMPVAPRSFDIAFSVGVLHHTPDPRRAFLSVEAAVRPGGRVVAWVYGRENNGWLVYGVNPIRERVTSRLPFRAVYELSRGPAGLLWALGRAVYKPLSSGPLRPLGDRLFYRDYLLQLADFDFEELHAIVHDHLTPPLAHYIEGSVFRSWFVDAGLSPLIVEWHNQNSWRGTGWVPEAGGAPRLAQAGSVEA